LIEISGVAKPIASPNIWYQTNKYRLYVKANYRFHRTLLLASRQLGKTTLALAYILWTINFYDNVSPNAFITIDKSRSQDAIKRIKFMHSNLPLFLKTPAKRNLSDRLTYFELTNGSKIETAYASAAVPASSVMRGRSLQCVGLVDEAAFQDFNNLLTSIGQAHRKAAEDAAYSTEVEGVYRPHYFSAATTPNGSDSQELFYNLWQNATNITELLVEPQDPLCDEFLPHSECIDILNQTGRNGYTKIMIHWSEIYDEAWYEDQRKLLNFDKRRIAQEVDLVFLGSTNSIFDDDIFLKFPKIDVARTLPTVNNNNFNFFIEEIDPSHTYILGVDTAASASDTADFSAIALLDATTDKFVGTLRKRIPVLREFASAINMVTQFLLNEIGIEESNIKLGIERNSYGLGIIEYLLYDEEYGDLYHRLIYQSRHNKTEWVPGINTTASTRPLIINSLVQHVNHHPESILCDTQQNELRTLVQKANGRIEADKNAHDDLTLASAFCTYLKNILIKNGEISVGDETASRVNLSSMLSNVTLTAFKKETEERDFDIAFESELIDNSKGTNGQIKNIIMGAIV